MYYKFLFTKENYPQNFDKIQKSPVILTTDLQITQIHGGLQHITPYVFTSGHEYTILTSFTGNLSYNPIDYTLSPKHHKYDPDDLDSLFIVPSRGVIPEIDEKTQKLRVPDHLAAFSNTNILPKELDKIIKNQSYTVPGQTLPSSLMKTEYSFKMRLDLDSQLYNAVCHEFKPITTFTPIDIIEKDSNNNINNLINHHLIPPSKQGYKTLRPSQRDLSLQLLKNLPTRAKHIIEGGNTVITQKWWNRENLGNVPILIHSNGPTSASDIAGLDSNIKLTSQQQIYLSTHLSSTLQEVSNNTNISPIKHIPYNYDALAAVISRRFHTSMRHIDCLFPFASDSILLRSALSGVQSTHFGAIPTRQEYISYSENFSTLEHQDTTKTTKGQKSGTSFGLQLGWLLDVIGD